MESEEPRAPLVRGEEAFYTKKMPKSLGAKEGGLKPEKMHRKMEAEEIPSKRFDKEEKAKKWKVTAEKPEEREAKTKEKASRKLKASHSADLKPHRKEAIDKKVDKIQKSKEMRFEGQQSKDIAKDYLEGALDREGSLVMVNKLHRKLQKLKKVIRDSFVRQKLGGKYRICQKGETIFDIWIRAWILPPPAQPRVQCFRPPVTPPLQQQQLLRKRRGKGRV
ncbi:hypothetical protein COP1_026241 [Malus domestica]